MIKTDKIIIVEGRYDKIKLSSIVDAVIIETEGFGIFKNKEKQRMIRRLAQSRGIVILTDSDSAGFMIRSFITSFVPKKYITNVYIPDIYGKEKRKDTASKEGKLGVEGISSEALVAAFEKAGIGVSECEKADKRAVILNDFYEDGLTGSADSKAKRKELLKRLDLPERMSTKALLEIINIFLTYEQYKEIIREVSI